MRLLLFMTVLVLLPVASQAQRKVWFSGAARGVMYADHYENKAEVDTVSAAALNSGHTLADLGINVQLGEELLVHATARIRNDYGGFWGGGVTFDLREMYVRGILGKALRYQVGDIEYKMTRYTYFNQGEMLNWKLNELAGQNHQQIAYDLFYGDKNTWRQQGAAAEFGLVFKKYVEELNVSAFTARIHPTDFGSVHERLISGVSADLVQSKFFQLGANYVNYYDLGNTSSNPVELNNPVTTFEFGLRKTFGKTTLSLEGESGQSLMEWKADEESPDLEDYFYDLRLGAEFTEINLTANVGYFNVGPEFRAPGAQTKRIDFSQRPAAYTRYGNDQVLRQLSMMDLQRDASLYNMELTEVLMAYNPAYGNSQPYGDATPNRQGVLISASWEPMEDLIICAENRMMSDIVGYGTEELTDYLFNHFAASVPVHTVVGLDKPAVVFSVASQSENSSREGDNDYELTDLSTNMLDMGLDVALTAEMHLLAGLRTWKSEGSLQVPEMNMYSEIIDYGEFETKLDEKILSLGLQYRFNEKNTLTFSWQQADWEDEASGLEAYTFNQWFLNFLMYF